MLILSAILIASAALSTLDASAIKGHTRPHEDARSIKLAPVNNLDKQNKLVAPSAQQSPQQSPSVPILESTKKIYNDETIRRLASAVPLEQPVKPAEPVQPVPVASVPVVQAEPVQPAQPVVQAQQPVVPVVVAVPHQAPVVSSEQVQPVSVKEREVVPVVGQQVPAVIEPKSAVAVAEKVAEKPAAEKLAEKSVAKLDDLPPQSDRSAPIYNEVSGSIPVVADQSVSAPVQQPAVLVPVPVPASASVPAQGDLVVPAVPLQAQQEALKESVLQAKKEEVASPSMSAPASVEPLHIEVPAPDPGLVLSEPIDSTTKLLIDLDEHVQKFLPAEDQQQPAQPHKEQTLVAGVDYSPAAAVQGSAANSDKVPSGKSSGPLMPYSGAEDPIVPPLPSLEGVEKASAGSSAAAAAPAQSVSSAAAAAAVSSAPSVVSPSATRQGGQGQNQQQVISQLLDQLDSLQNRIQDTINQLVARRRYVMSALLRPMGTYVRRVRTNLERLQNRVNQLQAAAASVGGGGGNRPGGFVDAAAIETIRRRIDDISKRISDIVNRIRFSLTPTSAPLNSNGRK